MKTKKQHAKVLHGLCGICGHYGDDCGGTVAVVRAVNEFEALKAENDRLLNCHEELVDELKTARALAHYKKEWELYEKWDALISKAEGSATPHGERH